jgi:hypothetical protein
VFHDHAASTPCLTAAEAVIGLPVTGAALPAPLRPRPPRPVVDVLIDATTRDCHPLDPPPGPPGLPYPQLRHEKARFHAEVIEPGESVDPTGFEPSPPQVAAGDSTQGELFGDEFSEADAADGAPVSWNVIGGHASPNDGFVQTDAAESTPKLAS